MENSNSEIVKNFLKNIYKKSSSKEINKLKSDKGHILQVLKDGSEKAEVIASEKVKKIKEIIGF